VRQVINLIHTQLEAQVVAFSFSFSQFHKLTSVSFFGFLADPNVIVAIDGIVRFHGFNDLIL